MQLFATCGFELADAIKEPRAKGLANCSPRQTLDVHVGSADLAEWSDPENKRDTIQDLADKIFGGQQGHLLRPWGVYGASYTYQNSPPA
eukprot:SAG22_NODE_12230_length_451_cov_0.957386_1_plen_88_part_01